MLTVGQILKETYRIDGLLSRGGMAHVYLASHVKLLRKRYAIKLIHLSHPEIARRFDEEAQILAELNHTNIVQVSDWDRTPEGQPYLVMEHLEGEDLASYLRRAGGPLSVPVALGLCAQIGAALLRIHKAQIVHRDLKPANIFLCRQDPAANHVKLLDFGIAKRMNTTGGHLTLPGMLGTPAYMSPEQAAGRVHEIDEGTDQFALATILYEMLAGHGAFYRPFDDTAAILRRVISEDPPALLRPEPQIEWALRRALSKDKRDRFPSLEGFLAAIGVSSLTVIATPPPISARSSLVPAIEQSPHPMVAGTRHRILLGVLTLALLVVVVSGALVWQRHNPPDRPADLSEPVSPLVVPVSHPLEPRPDLAPPRLAEASAVPVVPAKPPLGSPRKEGPTRPAPRPHPAVKVTDRCIDGAVVKPVRGKVLEALEEAQVTLRPEDSLIIEPDGAHVAVEGSFAGLRTLRYSLNEKLRGLTLPKRMVIRCP